MADHEARDSAMKIAFVYDAVFPFVKGGGERLYYEVARRLARRHEVTIISWKHWPGANDTIIDGLRYISVGEPRAFYDARGRRKISEAASFGARVLPPLLRHRFDIIECASVPFLPLFSSAVAAKVRRAKLVATWFEYWDDYWLTYLGGASGRAARFTERMATRCGDEVIAISTTTAERLERARPRGRPIRIIEPGVDLDAIRNVRQPPRQFDLAFAGRLNAQKNVEMLIDAVGHARDAGVTLRCIVVGDGPERPHLEALVRSRSLSDQVCFTGRIEDDAAYYSALKSARVFAWPSVAEGFGIAALEAMACGLPVVAASSRYSATQTIVDHGISGLVVEPDSRAFAAELVRLLQSPARIDEMTAYARRRAEASTWDIAAEKVERVYERVVADA
jgi:glycosyltransferase involved in cell wall biosynthesis